MRFAKAIGCLVGVIAATSQVCGNTRVLEKADSIFHHMTPSEQLSQLVWVQADKSYPTGYDLDLGGIYFKAGQRYYQYPDKMTIAVQLDEHLNPFKDQWQSLPGLYTLASIDEDDIISTYLHFLKQICEESGIDLLILPDKQGLSQRAGIMITKMAVLYPDFYIERSKLAFEQVKRKNQIQEVLQKHDYWVIETASIEKSQRKFAKYADRLDMNRFQNRIVQTLARQLETVNTSAPVKMPNQLTISLGKASIFALQHEANTLPLHRDTVCFLTNQPYGTRANMLRKYAYVITSYDDIKISGAPIVIDDHAFIPPGILSYDRKVIFTGKYGGLVNFSWELIDGALIYSYEHEAFDWIIPQQLFGVSDVTGIFPYQKTQLANFQNTPLIGTASLGYGPPELLGFNRTFMDRIDSILNEAVGAGCTPGGQLAVAIDGSIVFEKSFGHLTYDSLIPVDRSTLYDLASVTKVTATLLAVMKLYEEEKINLDSSLQSYLPKYRSSNKGHITLRQLLAHNGGLRSYVPFWQKALSSDNLMPFYYENELDERADRRSYGLKPKTLLKDSLEQWILGSNLICDDSLPPYNYSDIGFMVLHQVVEKVTGGSLNQYLNESFYHKMDLHRLGFNPVENGFQLFEIAPTEYDYYFRNELVWGQVHDRNAAVFGGVAGHAGLFANAHDLLVILQTILQGGSYGGQYFLSPKTVAYFNQRFFPENRRALGWDKKDPIRRNVSLYASDDSFGHTGFSGTMVWVDPRYDLIFVFLSNRIHPNAENFQLNRRDIRTRLQDTIYEAMLTEWID